MDGEGGSVLILSLGLHIGNSPLQWLGERWCSCYGVGLVIERSPVRLPAVPYCQVA